jgi:hypothetical protein
VTLNALKESGHSSHSYPSHVASSSKAHQGQCMLPIGPCSLQPSREQGADEEVRKAAGLGLDDGAQRGRISFEVVKSRINHLAISAHCGCTVMALPGAFRAL